MYKTPSNKKGKIKHNKRPERQRRTLKRDP